MDFTVECKVDSYLRMHMEQDPIVVKQQSTSFSVEDMKKIKNKIGNLPLIARGIMCKEDALIAVQNGANAIWISNAGGRGLDTQPSTISVLKSIVKIVR